MPKLISFLLIPISIALFYYFTPPYTAPSRPSSLGEIQNIQPIQTAEKPFPFGRYTQPFIQSINYSSVPGVTLHREKKWLFTSWNTEEWFIGMAIVNVKETNKNRLIPSY